MNGRIYDPLLGRFLSADLVVQFPGSLQSYNRYSYVQNNPLTFTDPTGWILDLGNGIRVFDTGYVDGGGITTTLVAGKEVEHVGLNRVEQAAANFVIASEKGDDARMEVYASDLKQYDGAIKMIGLETIIASALNPEATSQHLFGIVGGMAAGGESGARSGLAGKEAARTTTARAKEIGRSTEVTERAEISAAKTEAQPEVKATTSVQQETANPRSLVSRQGPSEMTNNRVKRLTADMKENGFKKDQPIEVAVVDGKKVIIDGHHRTEAAIKGGIKEVPIKTTTVSSEAAETLARQAAEAAEERARLRRGS